MMYITVCFLVFGAFLGEVLCDLKSHREQADIGYFWQVTDFHFDSNYSAYGNPNSMCHVTASTLHYNLSQYGNYKCDSPWMLVESAIDAMNDIYPNPDFILWTGDSVPHVNGSTYNEQNVLTDIYNITTALQHRFPGVQILPSFGNHDPYPSNMMSPSDINYYESILNVSNWGSILPNGSHDSFLKGGYYSFDLNSHIKVICLNTALYYSSNTLTKNSLDPSNQLTWLAAQLEDAQLSKQKVYIAAHVPPGTFELAGDFKWFHDQLNEKYLDVIDDYSDIITAHFYGHEHTDSFRIYNGQEGDSPMFLSPAVTPWKSTIPGVGPNNPSIRLFTYSKSTSKLLDYQQFFLNLTNTISTGQVHWELEYKFSAAFDVPDLAAESVKQAAERIAHHSKYLNRYLQYNSVSAILDVDCDEACQTLHKCSIFFLRYEKFEKCMNRDHHHRKSTTTQDPAGDSKKLSQYMLWAVILLSVTLFLLALTLMATCFRRRHYILMGRGHGRFPTHYGSIEHT